MFMDSEFNHYDTEIPSAVGLKHTKLEDQS